MQCKENNIEEQERCVPPEILKQRRKAAEASSKAKVQTTLDGVVKHGSQNNEFN